MKCRGVREKKLLQSWHLNAYFYQSKTILKQSHKSNPKLQNDREKIEKPEKVDRPQKNAYHTARILLLFSLSRVQLSAFAFANVRRERLGERSRVAFDNDVTAFYRICGLCGIVIILRFLTMLKRRSGQKYFGNGLLCMPEGYLVDEMAYIWRKWCRQYRTQAISNATQRSLANN